MAKKKVKRKTKVIAKNETPIQDPAITKQEASIKAASFAFEERLRKNYAEQKREDDIAAEISALKDRLGLKSIAIVGVIEQGDEGFQVFNRVDGTPRDVAFAAQSLVNAIMNKEI